MTLDRFKLSGWRGFVAFFPKEVQVVLYCHSATCGYILCTLWVHWEESGWPTLRNVVSHRTSVLHGAPHPPASSLSFLWPAAFCPPVWLTVLLEKSLKCPVSTQVMSLFLHWHLLDVLRDLLLKFFQLLQASLHLQYVCVSVKSVISGHRLHTGQRILIVGPGIFQVVPHSSTWWRHNVADDATPAAF